MYRSEHTREQVGQILKRAKKIFFIGIGGVSMSSLAHISKENGYEVAGSDRSATKVTDELEKAGIKIFCEHSAENVVGCDAVVYTAAIPESNPELMYAKENGIPLIYRADYLGYIMSRYENRIGFSGMHGKSTATSMASHVFLSAGCDPTVVSGAELCELEGGTYRNGSERYFIMEACEYCDSFLSFCPNIAVILNIEMDHPDYFKDLDQIKSSFSRYVKIAEDGYAVVNFDDENVRDAVRDYNGKLVRFGRYGDDLDYKAENVRLDGAYPVFDVIKAGKKLFEVKLAVTGEHNVMNALATICCAEICGIDVESIKKGLESFKGAARRMEYKGSIFDGRASLYEDYAHHPTEIRATLKGAAKLTENTLWCVYQPHTYSRTQELFDEFICSFDGARVIFADIFAAREKNTTGISSADLAKNVDGAVHLESFEMIAEYLKANVKKGDIVIVMGAGDINKLTPMLTEM